MENPELEIASRLIEFYGNFARSEEWVSPVTIMTAEPVAELELV